MRPEEPYEIRLEKYGKTAMKDNDFMRFRSNENRIVLDEQDPDIKQLLCKSSDFKTVMEKDSAFFARAGIIDYSLLIGKIENTLSMDDSTEWLEDSIAEDPTLAHGVYFTEANAATGKKRQAFVIAIIDPLTGFT